MKRFIMLPVVMFAVIFIGCKKEDDHPQDPLVDDNQKPVVIIEAPSDGSVHIGGNSLNIKLLITDNINLSQYKIEIHNAFDGHSHGKMMTSLPFAWDTIVNVGGTITNPTFSIPLPADIAAGNYHITAQAIDAAGYASDLVVRIISLINPSDTVSPVIANLVSPDTTGGEISIPFHSSGDDTTLTISCDLTDNIRLSGYRIQVVKEDGAHKVEHGDEGEVIYEISNTNLWTTVYSLNIPLTLRNIDFMADPDHHEYAVVITAIDHVNNSMELEIPLHVTAFP